jgi:hypothetical protein
MDKNILNKAISPDSDPTPGYLMQDLIRMTFVSRKVCSEMQSFLLKKLETKAKTCDVYIKLKTLRVIKILCEKGMIEFRLGLRPNAFILRSMLNYTSELDILHGDTFIKAVREEARNCISILFKDYNDLTETNTVKPTSSNKFYLYNDTSSESFSKAKEIHQSSLTKTPHMNFNNSVVKNLMKLNEKRNFQQSDLSLKTNVSNTKKMEGFGNPYFVDLDQPLPVLGYLSSTFSEALVKQSETIVQGLSQAVCTVGNLMPGYVKSHMENVNDKVYSGVNYNKSNDWNSFRGKDQMMNQDTLGHTVDLSHRFRFSGHSSSVPTTTSQFNSRVESNLESITPHLTSVNKKENNLKHPPTDMLIRDSFDTSFPNEYFSFVTTKPYADTSVIWLINKVEDILACSHLETTECQKFIHEIQMCPKGHLVALILLKKLFPELQNAITNKNTILSVQTWKCKERVLYLLKCFLQNNSQGNINETFNTHFKQHIVQTGKPHLLKLHAVLPRCRSLVEELFILVGISLKSQEIKTSQCDLLNLDDTSFEKNNNNTTTYNLFSDSAYDRETTQAPSAEYYGNTML